MLAFVPITNFYEIPQEGVLKFSLQAVCVSLAEGPALPLAYSNKIAYVTSAELL